MRFEMARSLAWERIVRSSLISPPLAQMLDYGLAIGAGEYDAARGAVAAARARLDHFFGDSVAIIVPSAPGEAPEGLGSTGSPIFNRMWTALGVPCVTLPAGFGGKGLPVGVQLVGRIGEDARLMEAALFAERALAEAA